MQLEDQAPPKVLLVDDSKMIRVSAQKALGDAVDLVLAESGEAAWATLTADPAILAVFTDVSMPGLDGYQLLERIRGDERPGINDLPVIIVTGDQDDDAREDALARGATDFITKPFDRAELVARASGYATRDRLRRQVERLGESRVQDSVTGLGTGRYLGGRLKAARAHALRHGRPMALVEVALLNIPGLAERHGDEAASAALREIAQALAQRLRAEDVLARVGRTRLMALCPDCDADGAVQLAERLLDAVHEGGSGGEDLDVEAAAGVHVPGDDREIGLRTIYDAAHEAAERARAEGAGRVVVTPAQARSTAAAGVGEAEAESSAPAGTADGGTASHAVAVRAGDGETAAEAAPAEPGRAEAEKAAADAEETQEAAPLPTLDEALAMLDQPDGPERLAPHMPALLERCETLFRAAPPETARASLERLQAQLDERAAPGGATG